MEPIPVSYTHLNELQMWKDSYQEMLEMYVTQLFIKLQRHFNNSIRIDNSRTAETIDMAIAYFNEHYSCLLYTSMSQYL